MENKGLTTTIFKNQFIKLLWLGISNIVVKLSIPCYKKKKSMKQILQRIKVFII